jgi:hypothetical protein
MYHSYIKTSKLFKFLTCEIYKKKIIKKNEKNLDIIFIISNFPP